MLRLVACDGVVFRWLYVCCVRRVACPFEVFDCVIRRLATCLWVVSFVFVVGGGDGCDVAPINAAAVSDMVVVVCDGVVVVWCW